MAPLLEVSGLTVDFEGGRRPVRAVDGVSFSLARGESLGIVGESGCGKTATALAIMRLLPEAARVAGAVRFGGDNILNIHEDVMTGLRGRRIAMVFQEPMSALNPVRTIGDQIAEGPRLHLGLSRRAARERTRELLDQVGLPPPRFSPDLYPHELSGGQRQRVVVAIALSSEPSLLIADEPTTALDVTTQSRILDLIVAVTDDRDMSLIMISHDLGVIAEMTDRMIVLYAGKVAEHGPTADVFSAMAHPYTEGLFEALPAAVGSDAAGPGTRLRTIGGHVAATAPGLRIGCPFAERCRHATPRCRSSAPPPVAVSPGHEALCFHPLVPA